MHNILAELNELWEIVLWYTRGRTSHGDGGLSGYSPVRLRWIKLGQDFIWKKIIYKLDSMKSTSQNDPY